VFVNYGEEDEIYPLTTIDIAEAQRKDQGLKVYNKKGYLPQNNQFVTLQIDGQSPNLFYSNYITKTEKKVVHPMISPIKCYPVTSQKKHIIQRHHFGNLSCIRSPQSYF
jgi:hypothetical protein